MKNEELMSELYKKYSLILPEEYEFWKHISHDETDHAGWLRDLHNMVSQGVVPFDDDRIKIEVVESFSTYINEQIARTETDELSSLQVLSISMDLENSLLEHGFFGVHETDDPKLKLIFDELQKSTEVHYSMVKELWLAERSKTNS